MENLFKVGVFDLETSNLNADYGIILCGVFLDVNGDKPIVLRWDKMEEFKKDKASDRELCLKIKDVIESFDIVIGYNSSRFDFNFLKARLLKHGLDILSPVKHIDLYYTVKYKLKLHDAKLDSVAKFLGTKYQKTDVIGEMWVKALVGAGTKNGKVAMDYIVEHCIYDVFVLKEVFLKLKDMINIIKLR